MALVIGLGFAAAAEAPRLELPQDDRRERVVDDRGVFQGLLTRREWIKAFNYVVHTYDKHYKSEKIK